MSAGGVWPMSADPALLRAAALFVPLAAAGALWVWRRPPLPARAGILLACAWNLGALALLHHAALSFGWWRYQAEGGLLAGQPVDLYLGWVLLWGAAPALALPRAPLAVCALAFFWLDLLAMPRLAPVVELGPRWLAGEAAAVALCFLPAQLLARWTAERRNLAGRALLQAAAFGLLVLFLLPEVILQGTGGSWRPLLAHLRGDGAGWGGLGLQIAAIPAILGLHAVQEFARRGGGTPLPYDPPLRWVASGAYAYVGNPMQLSAVLLLAGWGWLLASPWVAAAGVVAHVYSLGIAAWDEGDDLAVRFGAPWAAYRRAVRRWWPRWRPWHPSLAGLAPPARLYVAAGCDPCSELGGWIAARRPVGLVLSAAEDHPGRDLARLTYDPGDGTGDEEGIAALARALEHVHLGWAFAGWTARLPLVRPLLQLLADASGGAPRAINGPPGPGPRPASRRSRLDAAGSATSIGHGRGRW
jgi:protein-S-isoprenylcysteine O-methyltransferase Ste14